MGSVILSFVDDYYIWRDKSSWNDISKIAPIYNSDSYTSLSLGPIKVVLFLIIVVWFVRRQEEMFALASDWGSPFGVFISQSRIRKVSTTCQRDGHPKIGPQVHLGPIKVDLLLIVVVVVCCVGRQQDMFILAWDWPPVQPGTALLADVETRFTVLKRFALILISKLFILDTALARPPKLRYRASF